MSVHRTSAVAGSAVVALLTFGAAAGAQDQPAPAQSAQEPSNSAPAPVAPSVPVPSTQAQSAPPLSQGNSRATQLPQINVTAPIRKPAARQVVQHPAPGPPISPADQLTAKESGFDAA